MSDVDFRASMRDALRQATPFALEPNLVPEHYFAAFGRDLVMREEPSNAETQFLRAATDGLAAIALSDREPALNATTGHVAESIAETLLAESGWTIVDQQSGDVSAGHGIDLAALAPDMESLFVIEVKGSLSAARCPNSRNARSPNSARPGSTSPTSQGWNRWGSTPPTCTAWS